MDTQTRDEIIASVEESTQDGGTNIASGVRRSLEALRNYNMTKGGLVVLLTDGQDNDGDIWLNNVIDEVLEQNVRFCTIAFSNSADKNLEILADK